MNTLVSEVYETRTQTISEESLFSIPNNYQKS